MLYKHLYTTRITFVSILLLFIVNFYQIISHVCLEPVGFNIAFIILMAIHELPKLLKNKIQMCSNIHDKINNRIGYFITACFYLAGAIGNIFLYKSNNICWGLIINIIFIILPAFLYLFSVFSYDSNADEHPVLDNLRQSLSND